MLVVLLLNQRPQAAASASGVCGSAMQGLSLRSVLFLALLALSTAGAVAFSSSRRPPFFGARTPATAAAFGWAKRRTASVPTSSASLHQGTCVCVLYVY